MSKTLTKNLTQKWLLILDEYEQIKNKNSKHFKTVKQLCEFSKVHRKDIRRYYERWIEAGKKAQALLPQKRGPKPGQLKILSKEEERVIMKIRRRFNSNEYEIQHLIKGHFNIHPSVSTIYRTFKRYPLNEKRKKAIKRYEKKYPGELIHADTYHIDPTMVDSRHKYRFIGFIDDCTRLCYAEIVDRATAAAASKVFSRAYKWFELHGFKPEEIMTDNGTEFTNPQAKKRKSEHTFTTTLEIFKVSQRCTRPYRPQTNGKIERFWRILQDECLNLQRKTLTKNELSAELNGFLYRYNYQRRHGALNYQTPLDKLTFIANLLPKL